ncbi:hypothetical protein OAS24_00685 [Candidatus Pelagibacter sp.]|nr:hypothetical protein [Candidatus Pelagibacter sp.]|tara:strand:+ start:487 stop:765 length:279 start_codon:yes stop_codon:yes gene_type:complete
MKTILSISVLILFSGCAQSTAFLGPLYTLGTTGNAFQAGASYGTSYIVKKATGKTTSENIEIILEKEEVKKYTKKNPEEFFNTVKKYIEVSN